MVSPIAQPLDLNLAAIGEDQGAGAVAWRRVFGDERAAAGRGIEVEEVAGKILAGIQLKIVLLTTLSDLQQIAGEQVSASARVKRNAGEVERIAGHKAGDRVVRHGGAVDLQRAGGARKPPASRRKSWLRSQSRRRIGYRR